MFSKNNSNKIIIKMVISKKNKIYKYKKIKIINNKKK